MTPLESNIQALREHHSDAEIAVAVRKVLGTNRDHSKPKAEAKVPEAKAPEEKAPEEKGQTIGG